jgi:hypothetical protein
LAPTIAVAVVALVVISVNQALSVLFLEDGEVVGGQADGGCGAAEHGDEES